MPPMVCHVHLLDTSVATDNVGDEIIVDASRTIIAKMFPDAYVSRSSSHDGLGHFGRELVADADIALLIGTNGLTPADQRRFNFVWTVRTKDIDVLRGKVVLFGVGANRDFDKINWRQKRLLSAVLSPNHVHSVRDEPGRKLMEILGFDVVNTSCPTLWGYGDVPPVVPEGKADRVVFTLTKHKPDPQDAAMIGIFREHYGELYFWPQQPRDLPYLEEIAGTDGIEVIAPNLAAYDEILASGPIDVIGTRLHGSIRGLKHGRRILAISIDNRARAIGGETNLPILPRDKVSSDLAGLIAGGWKTQMQLPKDQIDRFCGQFA